MRPVGPCRSSPFPDGRLLCGGDYRDTLHPVSKLVFPNIDVLPAKETGIDRIGTWSEHGQCCTECSQRDVDPRISMRQEDFPHFKAGTSVPATGVHKPASKSNPAPTSSTDSTV